MLYNGELVSSVLSPLASFLYTLIGNPDTLSESNLIAAQTAEKVKALSVDIPDVLCNPAK